MPRKSTGEYPDDWKRIAVQVKIENGWKCIRCSKPNDWIAGYVLTIHHLDMNPSNNVWWNLLCLCQRCHLQIQAKVVLERQWYLEHSEWFKPYVAGYYAYCQGLPDDREYVEAHMDELLAMGQMVSEP